MPCLPIYRLLVAAALLTGAIAAPRFGRTGPSDPCPGAGNLHPCATVAKPLAGSARPVRSREPAALRTAS